MSQTVKSLRNSSSSSIPKPATIPEEVLLPKEIEEAVIIQQWLNQQRGGTESADSRFRSAAQRSELVQMATENAVETLQALKAQWEADTHKQSEALARASGSSWAWQRPAQPHRMLRYLQHPGHSRGWQHGCF